MELEKIIRLEAELQEKERINQQARKYYTKRLKMLEVKLRGCALTSFTIGLVLGFYIGLI